MSNLLKNAGFTVAIILATCLSGFASLAGAMAGGLRQGGWNWQAIPPLLYGTALGFASSLILLAVAPSKLDDRSRGSLIFFGPLLICFSFWGLYTFILLTPERQQIARYQDTVSAANRRSLFARARTRPLDAAERDALRKMTGVPNALSNDETSFLLALFVNDPRAVAALIRSQVVSPEQLRQVYRQHHDLQSSLNVAVLLEIAKHPLTPRDVLDSLAQSPERKVRSIAEGRLAKASAR